MNQGNIKLFADNSEVSTFNNGKIDEMVGKSLISANMNGEIGYKDKQTIILYSPQESAKRMNEYRQEKEEKSKVEDDKETQTISQEKLLEQNQTIEDNEEQNQTQQEKEVEEKIDELNDKKETIVDNEQIQKEETIEIKKHSKKRAKQLKIDDINE